MSNTGPKPDIIKVQFHGSRGADITKTIVRAALNIYTDKPLGGVPETFSTAHVANLGDGHNCKLKLWSQDNVPDELGQPDVMVFCSRLDSPEQVKELDKKISNLREIKFKTKFFLIGTACEADSRNIEFDTMNELANKHKVRYIEVDAKTGFGIDKMKHLIVREHFQHKHKIEINENPNWQVLETLQQRLGDIKTRNSGFSHAFNSKNTNDRRKNKENAVFQILEKSKKIDKRGNAVDIIDVIDTLRNELSGIELDKFNAGISLQSSGNKNNPSKFAYMIDTLTQNAPKLEDLLRDVGPSDATNEMLVLNIRNTRDFHRVCIENQPEQREEALRKMLKNKQPNLKGDVLSTLCDHLKPRVHVEQSNIKKARL